MRLSEGFKNFLLVASNTHFGAVGVVMLMEFGEQQVLSFLNGDVYGNPSLVIRMNDTRIMDAVVSEPSPDVSNGFRPLERTCCALPLECSVCHISQSLERLYFGILSAFLSVENTELTSGLTADSPPSVEQWLGNSHIHEIVITLFQVGLRQANAQRDHSTFGNAGALGPVLGLNGTLLVDDMSDWSWSSIDDCCNGGQNRELDKHD